MRMLFFTACRVTFLTLLLTGVAYPLMVTACAQGLFGKAAQGSLVADEQGRVVGSKLIAQGFAKPAYFHPRPSAANYDGAASTGSNLGPTSKTLVEREKAAAVTLAAGAPAPVPADLVTTSGSGLDPHLSPQGVAFQVARVAAARGIGEERVTNLLQEFTEGRTLGFLGEPRVNVLLLNLALDRRFGRPH